MVTNQGESSPVVRNVMTLDTCAAIIGSEVMSFKTEEQLLTVIIPLAKVLKLSWLFEPTKCQYALCSAAPHHCIVCLQNGMQYKVLLKVIMHAILQPILQLLKCTPISTDLLACCELKCT